MQYVKKNYEGFCGGEIFLLQIQKSTVEFKKNVCVALVSDIFFQNILSQVLIVVAFKNICRLLKVVVTFNFRSDQINYAREKPKSNN